MTFKFKAWMIYLIGLGVYSIFIVESSFTYDWIWDLGLVFIFGAWIVGGITLGLYYIIKSIFKNFKLKAWMVYLISIVVLPFPLLQLVAITATRPTEQSFASNIGSMAGYVIFWGGIILAVHYGIKRVNKKKEQGTK